MHMCSYAYIRPIVHSYMFTYMLTYTGFHGVDCSLRVCPSGRAWVDLPHNDNLAHANFTECSNMGKCNRLSGECECNFGYTGAACERLLCPIGTNSRNAIVPCSGHGICMSSRDRVELNVFSSNTNNNTYDEWDADMIYACNCDDGWQGSSCHLRTCPYGEFTYLYIHLYTCHDIHSQCMHAHIYEDLKVFIHIIYLNTHIFLHTYMQ